MHTHFGLLRTLLGTILIGAVFSTHGWSQDKDDRSITITVLGDGIGVERGVWRTKVQHVFDARTRSLIAKRYSAFDAAPSRNLDFVWIPDDLATDRDGPISGQGQLIWRVRGVPSYDPSSVFSAYVGEIRHGRPQGRGRYIDRDGLAYDGYWEKGRFEGVGVLQLPNGEEYDGKFDGGLASGLGRYVDMTGEKFEGRFIEGLREGEGKTTLPGGMTYRSQWSKGIEVANSMRIRIAQLGNQPAGFASADAIRLGATVQKKPIPPNLWSGEILGYASKVDGDRLTVEPDDQQLVSVWKKHGVIESDVKALKSDENSGSIYRESLFGFDKNIIYPPIFSFDLQNRSTTRIEITGFYLDVKKSQSENHPALELHEGHERETCGGDGGKTGNKGNFAPYVNLTNYGWTTVEQATLRYAFRPASEGMTAKTFQYSTDIKAFDKTTRIDVTAAIASAGGKLDLLRRYGKKAFQCNLNSKNDAANKPVECLASVKNTGAFGSLADTIELSGIDVVIGLRGTLEYKYKNNKGETISDESPFKADLSLGGFQEQAECGEGGPPEVIRKHPVALKLDQENYKLPLPLQTKPLDPGQSRQFTLGVSAPQASNHEFQLVAKLSDGREVRSRSIDLLYFTPKWYPSPNY